LHGGDAVSAQEVGCPEPRLLESVLSITQVETCVKVPGPWGSSRNYDDKGSVLAATHALESTLAGAGCANLRTGRAGVWKHGRETPAAGLKPRAMKSKSCGLTLARDVSPLQWAS